MYSDEDSVSLLPHSTPIAKPASKPSRGHYLLAATFYILSATFVLCGVWQTPSYNTCIQRLNLWSPMLDAIKYRPSISVPEYQSQNYVGSPTPDLEREWDKLWQFGSLGIAEQELPLLNKSLHEKDWHYLPESIGGGIQAYFEGFHYLHCLNLIRQYLHRDEYDYSYIHAFRNEHIGISTHVDHCVEMLRVKLSCDADPSLYQVLVDKQGQGVIIAGANEMCRDFGALTAWANKHITLPFDGEQDA